MQTKEGQEATGGRNGKSGGSHTSSGGEAATVDVPTPVSTGTGKVYTEEKITKPLDNGGGSGIIEDAKGNLKKYIGQPIVKTDNQHIREWYYANVSDIPNQIDPNLPIEEKAKQAFELRNKYKHQARKAMTDVETAELLEKKRPAPEFEELVKNKMRRKGMTRQEAVEDIYNCIKNK